MDSESTLHQGAAPALAAVLSRTCERMLSLFLPKKSY